MKYAVCRLSAIPMREKPSDKAEMTNQMLFGETAIVLETVENWSKIQLTHDNYIAWVDAFQLTMLEELTASKNYTINNLYDTYSYNNDSLILTCGALIDEDSTQNNFTLLETAKHFLNTPYLWGGRSFMGIDCSGFTQIVFRVHGISLLRDAYQQITQGINVDFNEAQTNDLAFFHNKDGRITHVGIVIKEDNQLKIIHASKKVRIDLLDEKGIYNEERQCYTHQFHSIKRIIND
ncbi:MAG: C40 family peptidase [Chitinophagales bacterium]|nr:C40 family peptidase [Chitinophagales bacterium]